MPWKLEQLGSEIYGFKATLRWEEPGDISHGLILQTHIEIDPEAKSPMREGIEACLERAFKAIDCAHIFAQVPQIVTFVSGDID
jgi:hypothetical protein